MKSSQAKLSYMLKYRALNPGKIRLANATQYAKRCEVVARRTIPTLLGISSVGTDGKQSAEYRRAYYLANKSKYVEHAKAWMKSHPGYARVARVMKSAKRRATLRIAPVNDLTRKQWESRLTYFGHRCAYCLSSGFMEQEHMNPVSRGGSHTVDNVVPACRTCNATKGAKTLLEVLCAA